MEIKYLICRYNSALRLDYYSFDCWPDEWVTLSHAHHFDSVNAAIRQCGYIRNRDDDLHTISIVVISF